MLTKLVLTIRVLTYSLGMITLTGNTSISTLKKQIQTPQDGVDNVEQISIQPAFQDLLNNIYCTIDKLPYLKPSLCMFCLDGTNITIKAFSGLWASKKALSLDYTTLQRTNDVTLNGTAVFGGGGYVANTTYYVYAKYDPSKTDSTDFVIRTDAPDTTKTWLAEAGVTQYNHRYIGSVLTNSLPACEVFSCSNGDYNLGTTNSGSTFTDVVFTDIQYLMLPKTATSIKLQIACQNTTAATDGNFYIKPKGTSSIRFIDVPRSSLYRGADILEIPCISSTFNVFQIRFQGAGLVNGDCTAKLGMVGYKE